MSFCLKFRSGVALFRSGSFWCLELLEDDLSLCRVRPLFLLQTLRLVISVPAGASWASRWVGVRFHHSCKIRALNWFEVPLLVLREFLAPSGEMVLSFVSGS